MSIQATTGSGSLFALGLSAGDIVTLYGLGRQFGNWFTAGSGDAELLNMVGEDEGSLLKRRGTVDVMTFKRRWGRKMRLLENGRVLQVENNSVEELLDQDSRFTIIMICIVAALDEFASKAVVRITCNKLLQSLVEGTPLAEELMESQLDKRIESWRSAAAVRGMNVHCRELRRRLQLKGRCVDGFMHRDDAVEMAEFLHWLLAEQSEERRTSSSDVAGVAFCLVHLSFEILTLKNFELPQPFDTSCRLVYQAEPISCLDVSSTQHFIARREPSTTVSLSQLEETFSTFPISPEVSGRCRKAWTLGQSAAKDIGWMVDNDPSFIEHATTLLYKIHQSNPARIGRIETKYADLAFGLAFVPSEPFLAELESALGHIPKETLVLLGKLFKAKNNGYYPFAARDPRDEDIVSDVFSEPKNVDAFCIVQAFFMGYYYDLFLPLVDTSALEVQTVSGAWGYRSVEFLRAMSTFLQRATGEIQEARWGRPFLLTIMSMLFTNRVVGIPSSNTVVKNKLREQEDCVGIIGKRTILINSILHDCGTLQEVGSFVLLDTDFGVIPHDSEGIIRTGIPSAFAFTEDGAKHSVMENGARTHGPATDFTRHIEVDWEGKSENLLLCIRYNGRRVGRVNPTAADVAFCRGLISPSSAPPMAPFNSFYECTIRDFISAKTLVTPGQKSDIPVVVQTKGQKCMRYAAASWYAEYGEVILVNESLSETLEQAKERRGDQSSRYLVLVA